LLTSWRRCTSEVIGGGRADSVVDARHLADVNRSLLVVRPSTLFNALVGLFEVCWPLA
jgi:hypothetical protein